MTKKSALELFNSLYAKHYAGFVRFANSYIRDTSTAEDFVTEAFMTYWDNKYSLEVDSNIQAYILTVVKNKCLNYLRETQLHEKVLRNITDHAQWEISTRICTLEACNPDEVFSLEIQNIVEKTLAELPPRTLEIFILSRYMNKSHKEIAEAVNITTKGVEFHITKALNVLRVELKDYLPVFIAGSSLFIK